MAQENSSKEPRWYVVHTYSGYENKVKTDLEKTIKNRELEDYMFSIVVPMEEQVEIKDGKISYIDMKSRQKVEKEFKVSLSDIHEKLRKVEYVKEYDKCKDIKDTEIERTKTIPFAYVYYYHFAKNLQIPSPNEFVDEYFDMFCYKKKNGMFAFKKEHDISHKPNFEFKY